MSEKTLYEYENMIRKLVKEDNKNSVHFSWDRTEQVWLFNLATWNPKHKSAFLLHTVPSETFRNIIAYKEMYEYVLNLKEIAGRKDTKGYPEDQYEVTWFDNNKNKHIISFFWGRNLGEILRKFYFDKPPDTVIYNTKIRRKS